jgi:hypothetical protein
MPVDPWSRTPKSWTAIQTGADLGGHRDSEPDFQSIPIVSIVWNLGTATSGWPKTSIAVIAGPMPSRSRPVAACHGILRLSLSPDDVCNKSHPWETMVLEEGAAASVQFGAPRLFCHE